MEEFKNYLTNTRGFSENTITSYLTAIRQFKEWLDCPLEEANINDLDDWVNSLKRRGRKHTTLNLKINAVKSWRKFYERNGGDHNNIVDKELYRVKETTRDIVREKEVKVLLDTLDSPRKKAMLAILFNCGLRKSELVKLNKASFVEKDDYVVVKVKDAKGKKDREVYMSYKYYKYVKAYMSTHSNPALFVSQRGTRISERQAGVVINSISDVIGKELTPHDYRASCLTYMYEQGVDINTIADIAGHENIQTTRGYIQANEKETSKRALSAF